jgi:alkanesulfonate monooxygenase SsuD/methylene tetrahydromethanopterin reductase-like flavin-dependent oxidoreductase (luciferase family)
VRLGVQGRPPLSTRAVVDFARELDGLGYDSFWVVDAPRGDDPFTILAAAAVVTQRIRLATGVAKILNRHPATLAALAPR